MQVAGAINSNTRAVSKARPSWSRENVGKFFFKDAYHRALGIFLSKLISDIHN